MNVFAEKTVSVVVPTYNRKELLKKCLESLMAQDYPKDYYEIIVIDDGSKDGTVEIVSILEKISPVNIRYFKQSNQGAASARNTGIKKSKFDIIAFIDDDCVAKSDWLTNLIIMFTSEDIGGVEGKVEIVGEKTALTYYVNNEKLSGGNYITANIAYTKDVLRSVNFFDVRLLRLEDLDLAFRVIKKNKKIAYSDKAIVFHPAVEYGIIEFSKRLKFIKCYSKLFLKNPELGSIKKFLLFRVFIRPFSLTRWKTCVKNPEKIPKFVTIDIIESIYCLYLLMLIVLKKM